MIGERRAKKRIGKKRIRKKTGEVRIGDEGRSFMFL